MKKLLVLFAVVLSASMLLTLGVFAAYNYGSPPGPNGAWAFNADKSYTIDGCMDLLYKKGKNGWLSDTMSSATTNVKARPYYYAHADVGIQGDRKSVV